MMAKHPGKSVIKPQNTEYGYVLGVDGGGTKTIALAADFQGNVLGRGISGASNYQTVGLDRAVAALKKASDAAMDVAGVERSGVACFGLAGVGRESDRDLLLPAIRELGLADKIILEHDAAIALAGAIAGQPGVVVLAGTGAMAFGMNNGGETRRAGGWGNVLADEGSAYYIGRRALAAACRAYDGRGSETALVTKFTEHFGLDHFTDMVREIYKEEASPQKIAFLAPLVSQSAEAGDRIAAEILRDAAEELALAARAVIKGLNMEDEGFQVAASGSVFNAGDLLLTPFAESVKSIAPRAEVISPRFEPAMGAVFLALQAVGVDLSEVMATD